MARVLVGVVMTRNTTMTSLERCLQTSPHLRFLLSLNTRPPTVRDLPWSRQCRSLRLHQVVGQQALCLQSLLREPQLYSSTHTSHSQEKVSWLWVLQTCLDVESDCSVISIQFSSQVVLIKVLMKKKRFWISYTLNILGIQNIKVESLMVIAVNIIRCVCI